VLNRNTTCISLNRRFRNKSIVAAYLLLQLSGKEPTEKNITAVLEAGGVKAEKDRIASLLKSVEGQSVNDLIAAGSLKISVGGGGGGAAAAAPAADAGKKEEAKPKKEEKKEESDGGDMGFGLFD